MIEIENTDIKIYSNRLCKAVKAQLTDMALLYGYNDKHIRVMPNAARGYQSITGFTGRLDNVINPALCGTDIGCGVLIQNLGPIKVDIFALQRYLTENIPTGSAIRNQSCNFSSLLLKQLNASAKQCIEQLYGWLDDIVRARIANSIGTLGGGDHFIELDVDDATGNVYLVIHAGSRTFGKEITKRINYIVRRYYPNADYDSYKDIRRCGHLFGYESEACLTWAKLNRAVIAQMICEYLQVTPLSTLDTIHNNGIGISRKGAVSANKGEKCIILLGKEYGVMLCEGKGNDDWNCSAPSGMNQDMELGEFLNLIRPTVKIKNILTPIFSFKPMIK